VSARPAMDGKKPAEEKTCKGRERDEVTLTTSDGRVWTVRVDAYSAIQDGKVGIVKVKKHGRTGSPHTRLLCVDYEHECLYWLKSEDKLKRLTYNESKTVDAMSKNIKSMSSMASLNDDDFDRDDGNRLSVHRKEKEKNIIQIYNILDIVSGKKTKTLQRFAGRKASDDSCFSVVCLNRTLDLQASDKETADQIKGQLHNFYNQAMGLPLASSEPEKILDYDPQMYVALSDTIYSRVTTMLRDIVGKWQDYMWADAAEKIVKDYPRLAKNMRVWEVSSSNERKRVDGDRKNGWGHSVVAVMEALTSMMADEKRGEVIVKSLKDAVQLVEDDKRDREQTLRRFFNTTFSNISDEDDRRGSFSRLSDLDGMITSSLQIARRDTIYTDEDCDYDFGEGKKWGSIGMPF